MSPRRFNKNFITSMIRHVSLTRISNEEGRQFGFGITDEGEEVYIPAFVVRTNNMTEADVGAGLSCVLRENPRSVQGENTAPWLAQNPTTWDQEDAPGSDPETQDPAVDDLLDAFDAFKGDLPNIDAMIRAAKEATKTSKLLVEVSITQLNELLRINAAIDQMTIAVDNIAPEDE